MLIYKINFPINVPERMCSDGFINSQLTPKPSPVKTKTTSYKYAIRILTMVPCVRERVSESSSPHVQLQYRGRNSTLF